MQQDMRRKKESMGTHKELPSSWQQDRRQKTRKKNISKMSWARLSPWQQDKKRRIEKQQGSQDKESHEQLGSPWWQDSRTKKRNKSKATRSQVPHSSKTKTKLTKQSCEKLSSVWLKNSKNKLKRSWRAFGEAKWFTDTQGTLLSWWEGFFLKTESMKW